MSNGIACEWLSKPDKHRPVDDLLVRRVTMDNSTRIENEGVKYPDLDSVLTFRNVLRTRRAEAYEKSRKEGYEEGRKEGYEEGRKELLEEIVLHMAGQGMESDQISRLTGLKHDLVEQAMRNKKVKRIK